jgi:hypothetical protein
MPAVEEMLKASEAAVVSRVSLRDVNRVIDEHILPDAFVSLDNGRHVLAGACSFIAFYFESAKRLTSEERLFAIKTVGPRLTRSRALAWAALLREDWIVRDEFLTIDLLPFVRGISERLDDLAAAREIVTTSDDVLGGTPVIRGHEHKQQPCSDSARCASGAIVERPQLFRWLHISRERQTRPAGQNNGTVERVSGSQVFYGLAIDCLRLHGNALLI